MRRDDTSDVTARSVWYLSHVGLDGLFVGRLELTEDVSAEDRVADHQTEQADSREQCRHELLQTPLTSPLPIHRPSPRLFLGLRLFALPVSAPELPGPASRAVGRGPGGRGWGVRRPEDSNLRTVDGDEMLLRLRLVGHRKCQSLHPNTLQSPVLRPSTMSSPSLLRALVAVACFRFRFIDQRDCIYLKR